MNKIAVFGDSFASKIHEQMLEDDFSDSLARLYKNAKRQFNPNEIFVFSQNWGKRCISWIDYLDADTYGWMGSDFYYSYNQFIKHQHKYEKCIVVITGNRRYSSKFNNKWMHCVDIPEAFRHAKTNGNVEKRSYYKQLLSFFKNIYFEDLERVDLIHEAMINSILSIRPDTILIHNSDLESVYKSELKAWDIPYNDFKNILDYVDVRQCHMTNDNNYILANFILQNLNKTGYIDLSTIEWKIPSLEEKKYYLIKIENVFGELL